ncbi:hypothetical protein AHAS_Ahas09G0112500 [Arachis hypogaea]
MKEILKSQLENENGTYVFQVEEVEILEGKEMVEDLGKVEQEASLIIDDGSAPTDVLFEIVEYFLLCCEIDDKEDCAQPLTHNLSNKECVEKVSEQGIELEEACQEVEVIKEESKGMKFTLPKPSDIFLP